MKTWCLVLAMMGVLAPAGANAVEDAGAHVLTSVPPKYPPEAARAGAQGTAVLVVTIGANGAVENVLVESSSGHRSLDAAAIDAANDWTYAPAIEHGKPVRGRVRVPVDFNMANEDEPIRGVAAGLAPRLRVPAMAPDEKGTLPQFIEDPLPLEAGSVAAMADLLQAKGTPIDVPGLPRGIALYSMAGENGQTDWEVYTGDIPHAPTVVRKRVASDGVHGFFVTRVLCESPKADACARFLAYVKRPARQPAVPLEVPDTEADAAKRVAPGG